MNEINFGQEIAFYKKKHIGSTDVNISDLYGPFTELVESMKAIEEIETKNAAQMEAILESIQLEVVNNQQEIIKLASEADTQTEAYEKTLLNLIQVADKIDKLYQFALESNKSKWVKRLDKILSEVQNNMHEVGLYEIPAEGQEFDEKKHQCVKSKKDAKTKEGFIIEVRKKGYGYNGKVIRKADVVVAK